MAKRKEKKRLTYYGTAYWSDVKNGKAAIIVRGVFQARKGDSYHVRVYKKMKVIWKDDFYIDNYKTPSLAKKAAIKAAHNWVKSAVGKKAIGY